MEETFSNMREEDIREARLMLDAAVAFRGVMSSAMRREIMKRFCKLAGLEFYEPSVNVKRDPFKDEELQAALREFISKRCEVSEIATCSCRELYEAFSDWCLFNGLTPPPKNVVGGALRQMKLFVSYKSDATRKWQGISIRNSDEEDSKNDRSRERR